MSAVADRVYERWIDSGDGLTFEEWRAHRRRQGEERQRQARFYRENAKVIAAMQQAPSQYLMYQQAALQNLTLRPGQMIPVQRSQGGILGGLLGGAL